MTGAQGEVMAPRWTPSQEQAIRVREKDILVSAAAGSGKTSVLVERIIRRLLDPEDPVDIDRMLVVTFTESAAGEMRERIRLALERAADAGDQRAGRQLALLGKAAISTLHGFCLQLIRRHFYLLGIDPRFRVLDAEEASLYKLEAMDELFERVHQEQSVELLPLIAHYGGARDDGELRRIVLDLYEYVQSLPDGKAWLERAARAYDSDDPQSRETLARWQESLLFHAEVEVHRALARLAQAMRIAQLGAGPVEYLRSFEPAYAGLERALEPIRQGRWDDAASTLGAVVYNRLPKTDADPVLREEAKKGWEEAKKIARDVAKGIFGRSMASYVEDLPRLRPVIAGVCRLVLDFEKEYQRRKEEAGGVDFADLERLALAALDHPSGRALSECRRRFVDVLVDEYQDINPVQDRLITLVSRRDAGVGNRFLVGDVKQSIYRFRLADPRIFQEKHRTFAEPDDPLSVRVDLQANFRSRPEILEAVNFVFRQIMFERAAGIEYDESARLRPGKETGDEPFDPDRVEMHLVERLQESTYTAGGMDGGRGNADDEEHGLGDGRGPGAVEEDESDLAALNAVEREATLVGHLIRRLVREGLRPGGEAVTYRDIAILMRSPKGRVSRFIEVLEAMGIPAHSGSGSGFFHAVEVQVVMSLLRLIDNPRQDIPLAAVLRSPICGLDERELAEIRALDRSLPFHQAVFAFAGGKGELAERVARFLAALDRWRTLARRVPLSRLIATLYEETKYVDFVAALPRGRQREANLRALWRRARHFDSFSTAGLDRFIRHVDDLEEAGEEVAPPASLGEGEDVVRVMSVHQSKGLEFPVVFVVDLDRQFNLSDSRRTFIYHSDLGIAARVIDRDVKVSYPSLAHRAVKYRLDQETVAEEMRLLYVALTRAKEKLILVSTARDLEARAAKAAEASRLEGWQLPLGQVVKARSWLDWLLAAVARHRDGWPIRALGAGDLGAAFYEPVDPQVAGDSARFAVHVWPGETIDQMGPGRPGKDDPDLPWSAIAQGLPVEYEPDPQMVRDLQAAWAWSYPHARSVKLPAKVSVTEVVRRFESQDDEAELLIRERLPELSRPWFEGDRPLSAAERGLAVHAFLARMDLSDVTRQGLAAQAEDLARRGILTPQELSAIDFVALERFFDSDLGRRIRAAGISPEQPPALMRELAFTMRLAASAFSRRIIEAAGDAADDVVVVQGTIDCLVREPDRYIVVDYKTDAVRLGEERAAARRYEWQLRLYREFVRRSAPGVAVEAHLVFLRTGTSVWMP